MTISTKPGLDAYHKERSKCLDAFAGLEDAVISLLELTGSKVGGEPFRAKVDALAKAKAGPRYSKARKARVQDVIVAISEIADRRNDLVHSQLKLAVVDDEHWAQFTNVRQREKGCGHPLQLNLEGLRRMAAEAQRLASELQQP